MRFIQRLDQWLDENENLVGYCIVLFLIGALFGVILLGLLK